MRKRTGFVRQLITTAVLAYAVLAAAEAALAGNGNPLNPHSANELTFAVYGDAPYGTTPTDTAEFEATPAFIRSINADPEVRLVVHVGDIHSGKQYCTSAVRSIDLRPLDKRSRIRWSTRRATTNGRTATRSPRAAAYTTRRRQIDYVLDASGNPVDYASGDPVANLESDPLDLLPEPGVCARRPEQAGALAGHGLRRRPPDRREVSSRT